MKKKVCILFVLMISVISMLFSQDYRIEITLSDVKIIEECHFGDEWEADFSFGGKYKYPKQGDPFLLKPNQKFGLKSMISEGKEKENDYADTTTFIAYEDLKFGHYDFRDTLYVEDENTGRYSCNNATFEFRYIIKVENR